MCFSAQVSLGASALLGSMGIYALRKAKQQDQYLAMVPLFFAIQQACEGVVWLTHDNPLYAFTETMATYGFCFFAFFFWPLWIPLTTIKMEKNHRRRNILKMLLVVGTCVAALLTFLAIKNGVAVTVSCSHVKYDLGLPGILNNVGVFLYCAATILPFFISSRKGVSLFGILTVASVAASWFFYSTYFTSVWCFFAALLSAMIIWIV